MARRDVGDKQTMAFGQSEVLDDLALPLGAAGRDASVEGDDPTDAEASESNRFFPSKRNGNPDGGAGPVLAAYKQPARQSDQVRGGDYRNRRTAYSTLNATFITALQAQSS